MMKSFKSGNKRKFTVIFLSLFFFLGGGVFLFFINLGVEDMKSNDPSRMFKYSYEFKEAVLPLFNALGFTDGEPAPAAGAEIKTVSNEEFAEIVTANSADKAATGETSGFKRDKKKLRGGKTKIPKMPRKHGKLAASSSAGTKTSAQIAGFSSAGTKGASVEKSGSLEGGGKNLAEASAYERVKVTAHTLASANDTRSAMTAKSRWDKSFEGGKAVSGYMKYDKGGVKLDDIGSKPLIESLKEKQTKSLDVPEVGKPEKVASSASKEDMLNQVKDSLDPTKGLANKLFEPIGKGIAEGASAASAPKGLELPKDVQDYIEKAAAKGEPVTVTQVSCSNDPAFCRENGVRGSSYYMADYPGVPGADPPYDMPFQEAIHYTSDGELTYVNLTPPE